MIKTASIYAGVRTKPEYSDSIAKDLTKTCGPGVL